MKAAEPFLLFCIETYQLSNNYVDLVLYWVEQRETQFVS